ncbi:MAG: 16S rRNA (guanine(527)-N(7))-methyltransferase RsmG [Phycisphaerales bacterium]|nr:16S rRNA (guanine(527)-N(7))-methyltransferase RsmG [Phycisphaerales bacterium]
MSGAPPVTFLETAAAEGIVFDPGDLPKLERYLDLLYEANQRFNLTAIEDRATAWTRHILDSLTLLAPLAAAEAKSVIDVGSGGGLPGIPLAIAMPEVRFTLLEATGKKATFLREAVAALALGNVEVVNERAETTGQDHHRHRECYDAVIARAVGPLPVLLELTVPLARVGGVVLCVKGERAAQEIEDARQALHLLHAAVIDTIRTPTGTIVVIEKQRKTPRNYPRRPGEPKRVPLGGS